MEWFVLIAYCLALSVICIFSLEQLYLTYQYRHGRPLIHEPPSISEYPRVTIQLPIYNEKYVVSRLIDSVCKIAYPKEKLEIQVLDDSDDETLVLTSEKIEQWQKTGVDIKLVTRKRRTGYKAGALAHGLQKATGDYIAIFDADFLPNADFLERTLPHFQEGIGMVQTKWGHLNQGFNIFTEMQAFGLNAHFSIEQTGRWSSGKFMNFNGTAGIWKKECILEAGGWQFDTLTEDLDLSYRAQLKGWRFKYVESIITPAELPVIVPAIKSQQYRWNKGAAETARKNLKSIISSKLTPSIKLHATLHLLNSSVFIFLIIGAILSIPMLYIKDHRPDLALTFDLASVFIIGFIAMAIFYWVSCKNHVSEKPARYYLKHFPAFVALSMGMSLYNAIAVAEGYLGIKSPFIRTPKFNITDSEKNWKSNEYLKNALTPVVFLEGLLCMYFGFGIWYGISIADYGLLLFHLMLTLGFGVVFWHSLISRTNA